MLTEASILLRSLKFTFINRINIFSTAKKLCELSFWAATFIRVVKNMLTNGCLSYNLDLQNSVSHYSDLSYFFRNWPSGSKFENSIIEVGLSRSLKFIASRDEGHTRISNGKTVLREGCNLIFSHLHFWATIFIRVVNKLFSWVIVPRLA